MFFKKKRSETMSYKKIALPFILVSTLAALFVFYISFSWATITLTPIPKNESFTVSQKIVDGVPEQEAEDVIRGHVVVTTLEGDGSFAATGEADGKTHARGIITVVNKSTKDQPLRETTRLLSGDGTLFRTDKFALAPAGATVDVSVIADAEGEVPLLSGAKFTLPGLWAGLQSQIYGTGFVPLTETETQPRIVTREDREKASQSIAALLIKKFDDTLLAQSGNGWTPLKTKTFTDYKIISSSSDTAIGEKTIQFKESIKIAITGVVYDESDLMKALKTSLSRQVAAGTELIGLNPSDITASLDSVDTDESGKNSATLTIVAQTQSLFAPEANSFSKKRLAGMSAKEIIEYFKSYEGIKDVTISFYPFWVTRAPLLTDHIHILVRK